MRISGLAYQRDNLAFVMKCVGYHVQQDKRRTPEFATPIHGALSKGRVELLLREISHIGSCRFSYPFFSRLQGRHSWAIFFVPTGKSLVPQIVDPAFLTGQDMHKLLPNGRMAESRNRFVTEVIRHGCNMAQQKVQPLVGCGMQIDDSSFGEHDWPCVSVEHPRKML
jgi:hypothetical protein